MTKDIITSGVFSLGSLGGDGASTTRPTRRWGGITGRSLVDTSTDIEYIIVGGGGGGGGYHGAGGGGGGVLYGTATPTTSFALTVGDGGARNANGGDSEALGLTAIGGGSGGAGSDSGGDGGSGGGRGGWTGSFSIGLGTAGQGYNGGDFIQVIASPPAGVGGGGGGAGGVGVDAGSNRAGSGGIGLTNAFLNTLQYGQYSGGNYYVAGGGGAGGWQSESVLQGNGGVGGGGRGGYGSSTNYQSGTNGFGGGGGGKQQNTSVSGAGSGGSGVVILRYPSTATLSIPSSLTYTHDDTTVAGFTITTFTGGTGTVEVASGGLQTTGVMSLAEHYQTKI